MGVRVEQQQKPPLGDRWEDIQGAHSWEGLLDPFDPTLKSEILRYGDFVRVCYTAIKNHRILSERLLFKESENLQECGYEIRDYIYANVRLPTSYSGQESRRESWRTVWIGFISVCTDENEIRRLGRRDIVVAFRGISTPREWMQDLKDKVVPVLPGTNSNPDVGIRKRFWGFYTDKGEPGSQRSARHIIRSGITRLLEEYEGQRMSITVTGHSTGGALATMSAYDIKLLRPSIPVTVFAFSSPRVGNRAFADHMEEIGVKVLRVVVKRDLVPKVPGHILNEKKQKQVACLGRKKILRQWSYCHVGIKFPLDPRSSGDLEVEE